MPDRLIEQADNIRLLHPRQDLFGDAAINLGNTG